MIVCNIYYMNYTNFVISVFNLGAGLGFHFLAVWTIMEIGIGVNSINAPLDSL